MRSVTSRFLLLSLGIIATLYSTPPVPKPLSSEIAIQMQPGTVPSAIAALPGAKKQTVLTVQPDFQIQLNTNRFLKP
jgi:hypothetical protein